MSMQSLAIPVDLTALVARGSWPSDHQEANRQNIAKFIASELVKEVASDEMEIHLQPPPFRSIAEEAEKYTSDFWRDHGALADLDPERTLIIGDFGLGSDSPIILYYRVPGAEPEVWRLRWAEHSGIGNHWQHLASSFADFADRLDLASLRFRRD